MTHQIPTQFWPPDSLVSSRLIRTTDYFLAQATLALPNECYVRFVTVDEAITLAEEVRKKNLFVRASLGTHHYSYHFQDLGDRTVIEVRRLGSPEQIQEKANRDADNIEKILALSSTLVTKRDDFQRKLGIRLNDDPKISLIFEPSFRKIRSKTQRAAKTSSILIDDKFIRRLTQCGFAGLFEFCIGSSGLSERVVQSMDWLFESKREPSLNSAIVKTSIALETLLIFSESESLARALSERAAFILSSDPKERQSISRLIKSFYDARSGVVHGSKKKMKRLTSSLVESVDRLVLLMYLVIAANSEIWNTSDDLSNWCELQRWGAPVKIKVPYSKSYLANALKLGNSNA